MTPLGAEGLGGAENGAQVAGILEAGKHQDQRRGLFSGSKSVSQRPVGHFNQGGDGLRGLGLQDGIEQGAGHEQDFSAGRQRETLEAILGVFGYKDAGHMQIAAQSLFEQVQALDSSQPMGVASRLCNRPPQLFQAGILLALDMAHGHGNEASDSSRF